MQIICNKCQRIMEMGELVTYLTQYIGNQVAPILKPIVINALTAYCLTPKKSFFDASMAGIANIIEARCSQCNNKACWNPHPAMKVPSKAIVQDDVTIK